MKIETKYSLINMVWVMHENKPVQYQIHSIEPVIKRTYDGSAYVIRYRFEELGKLYNESELFESKKELLQSL